MVRMRSEEFRLESNEASVFVYNWLPEVNEEVKGLVQISHGMAEHAGRYRKFANELTDSNYVVYANDHRGHGKTAGSADKLGHFADEGGWDLVVQDMHNLTDLMKEEHPDIPIFLFGHSMGSFLARDFISRYGEEIDGTILSGTSGDPGPLADILIMIAKIQSLFKGRKSKSTFLNNLVFGQYNESFSPNRTDFDWLSRDQTEVDKYIEDSYCGREPSAGFFIDLFEGLKKIHREENIEKIPKELPILLISGERDPVGGFKEGVLEVYELYDEAGIKDISRKFYGGARHELLHETNTDQVIEDVIEWMDDRVSQK